MIIKNVSDFTDTEVELIVGFATHPINMHGVAVLVSNGTKAYNGTAYCGMPNDADGELKSHRYLITLKIGGAEHFPRTNVRWYKKLMPAHLPFWAQQKQATKWVKDHPELEPELRMDGWDRVAVWYQAPYGGMRSPVITYRDPREALCAVAAHEAFHIYQFKNRLAASEVACEKFSAKQLDAFREL